MTKCKEIKSPNEITSCKEITPPNKKIKTKFFLELDFYDIDSLKASYKRLEEIVEDIPFYSYLDDLRSIIGKELDKTKEKNDKEDSDKEEKKPYLKLISKNDFDKVRIKYNIEDKSIIEKINNATELDVLALKVIIKNGKLNVLGVEIMNEGTLEFFKDLMSKGVDAIK
jgi:hypothetical protein